MQFRGEVGMGRPAMMLHLSIPARAAASSHWQLEEIGDDRKKACFRLGAVGECSQPQRRTRVDQDVVALAILGAAQPDRDVFRIGDLVEDERLAG
jgi:hypothetical protein